MKSRKFKYTISWFGGASVFALASFIALPVLFRTSVSPEVSGHSINIVRPQSPIEHIQTPSAVKALYMTACVAATPSRRTVLVDLVDRTELNAVVLDIKDATGVVSFIAQNLETPSGNGCIVSDMRELVVELHRRGIYVIGRISVFQDPLYSALHPELAVKNSSGAVWRDHKGLSFIDVGAKPYWDYIVDLAKISYDTGFDELNFDYVRYPSDGNMLDIVFDWKPAEVAKSDQLREFFEHLSHELSGTGAKLSVDLFGMTTTVKNDLNIGQLIENAFPYFDYIAPMVYPSHYPPMWQTFANPAEHPYEVINIAMSGARAREEVWQMASGMSTSTPSKLRPWLQDFNLGATYTPEMVRAQIQATYDVGLNSWMLWNAGNTYTEAALIKEI